MNSIPTYSLLQISLDPIIDRESLERASDSVPSVTRADCAFIHRDLFGIVISGLLLQEANTFKVALEQQGFATEVVADHEIPVLHEPFTIQRIHFHGEALVFTDMMGREQSRPLEDLAFVAGGFLTQSKLKTVHVMEIGNQGASHRALHLSRLERQVKTENFPEFRLDFFWGSSPNRLRASISATSVMFFRDSPLRLKDSASLLGLMVSLRELLPTERVSAGLKRSDAKNFYPSLRSYEEEIRWHFHRLKKQF